MTTIIISLVWLAGFFISYVMQRTEMASEKEDYTKGDRLLIISLSILSFAWVLTMLIIAWVKIIGLTGYWNTPVNKVVEEIKFKESKTTAN
jgi:hypothetical protein